MKKTLILGLGNPILCDDSVGIHVAQELQKSLNRPDVTVEETTLAGLNLLDFLVGYDKAILIDAIQTAGGKPGEIYRFSSEEILKPTHTATNPHDVSFADALELGRRLNMPLPQEVIVFAIEAKEVYTFCEECTPEVADAIPRCMDLILQELDS